MQSSLTTRSSAACRAQWPVAARSGCIAAHPFRSLPSSYMHPFVPTYRASGDGCGCSSSAATSSSATNAATAHPTVGVVIVDHGSRKKASNDMLHDFGDLYQALSGREIVEVAHMEIASPTIEDAIGACATRGAQRVVIAPYFLSRGRHIQEDIPALVEAARVKYPGVECVIAEPIGIDALMAQLIDNRVTAALSEAASSQQKVTAAAQ